MIQLERVPNASEALLGGLVGYRRIPVGDRDWRVVWRVEQDEIGDYLIGVAEVWAVGCREDSEVYAEISQRIAQSGSTPKNRARSG